MIYFCLDWRFLCVLCGLLIFPLWLHRSRVWQATWFTWASLLRKSLRRRPTILWRTSPTCCPIARDTYPKRSPTSPTGTLSWAGSPKLSTTGQWNSFDSSLIFINCKESYPNICYWAEDETYCILVCQFSFLRAPALSRGSWKFVAENMSAEY